MDTFFQFPIPSGIAVGAVNLALAWFFIKMIEDRAANAIAGMVSMASVAIGMVAWAMRPNITDDFANPFFYAYLTVLGTGLAVACFAHNRMLAANE